MNFYFLKTVAENGRSYYNYYNVVVVVVGGGGIMVRELVNYHSNPVLFIIGPCP